MAAIERDKLPPDVSHNLDAMGRYLKYLLPPGFAYVLLLAPVGENNGNFTFYLSTAEREGSIKLVREFLGRLESEPNNQKGTDAEHSRDAGAAGNVSTS